MAACDAARSPEPEPPFADLFREVGRITLEEPAADPITEITSLTPLSDGGFLIVDGPAGRVREYAATGELRRSFGRPGEGPGELRNPSAAVKGPAGEVHVVERGSPRHTVFWSADSVSTSHLPGSYGFWLHPVEGGLAAGIGTSEERFAVLGYDGEVRARFGTRQDRIRQTPFWVFFAHERAAVLGDRLFINVSFSPTVRVFSIAGDSVRSFGTPSPTWIEPKHPGIETIAGPADRERLEEWARSFTVVTGLAPTDSILIVQYGRHDPLPNDAYRVVRRDADVYLVTGEKLVEGLDLSARILAGGRRIYLLESEPPDGWTISVREWAGRGR